MKKIMFNDKYGLTEAVLSGRKTMTRRALPKRVGEMLEWSMKPTLIPISAIPVGQSIDEFKEQFANQSSKTIIVCRDSDEIIQPAPEHTLKVVLKFSKYKIGEEVAVAQMYCGIKEYNPEDYEDVMLSDGAICEASHPYAHLMREPGWGNKMFVRADLMPHQIRITNIRIERLQDISDEDCLREGIIDKPLCPPGDITYYYVPGVPVRSKWDVHPTPREAFSILIDKVSGKGTWESNPYVFVYEFELVK